LHKHQAAQSTGGIDQNDNLQRGELRPMLPVRGKQITSGRAKTQPRPQSFHRTIFLAN
jgi:hypothetical protein